MNYPLVSCIMATADRPEFAFYAITWFTYQDYPNVELIIIDTGNESIRRLIPPHPEITYYYEYQHQSLNETRNMLCERSVGDIIVHWDELDWYSHDWVSTQVAALTNNSAYVTGLKEVHQHCVAENKTIPPTAAQHENSFLYGGTLAYYRSYWAEHNFKKTEINEDKDFLLAAEPYLHPHDYMSGYLKIAL